MLKKIVISLAIVVAGVVSYALILNRNSAHMTFRQKLLRSFYPLIMKLGGGKTLAQQGIEPPVSFHTLSVTLNNGTVLPFGTLKGKKVLLVNTASDCGYTHQYEALQKLADKYGSKLLIIGFPANDFKEQEKGTDEDIAQFCKLNFGVSFPLAKKSVVIQTSEQHPVFQWLTQATQNGWNNVPPKWNFSKYLINENGQLTHVFDPGIDPLSKVCTDAIEK